jgi:type II secretory pathway component PulK
MGINKAIAEEIARLNTRLIAMQQLRVITNIEDNLAQEQIERVKDQIQKAEDAKIFRDTSPKQYGISLLNRKHKKK